MSKRLITVLITVFTVMLLTGCNSDKKDVQAATEGFLNAMIKNDLNAASEYATAEFMESDTMKMMDPEYLADSFYAAIGVEKEDMSEETQAVVNEYTKNVLARTYKSFEIQDMKIQEDTASVTTKITLGYNPEDSASVPEETIDVISEYQTEHYDELISIYKDEGEKAMYKKMYNDLIPIVINEMQKNLENSEPSEEKTVLTLVKTDKKWLVTNLEENRPGSEKAEEEAAAAATTSASTEYAAEDITSEETAAEDVTSEEAAAEDDTSEESAEAGTTGEETVK